MKGEGVKVMGVVVVVKVVEVVKMVKRRQGQIQGQIPDTA